MIAYFICNIFAKTCCNRTVYCSMYINDIQNVCPNVDNLSTDDTDVFVHGKSEDVVDVATCLMLISLH